MGIGVGQIALLGLAQARCTDAAGLGYCSPLDLTPFMAVAAVFVVLGGVLTVLASRRWRNHT